MPRKRINNYIHKKPRKKDNKSWGESRWYRLEWWRMRSKSYRMAHPLCEMCEEVEITKESKVVDHIEPLDPLCTEEEFIRNSTEDNLQALCHEHHNQKTANERNQRS